MLELCFGVVIIECQSFCDLLCRCVIVLVLGKFNVEQVP